VSDGRVNEAGERPRLLVTFGTARPLTCILWKRPQHKPTSYGRGACLQNDRARTTLSYMKSASVTIRLDAKLERELNRLSRQLGRSRSELVRDALRRQLALARFEQARRAMLPLAEAQGFLTDEDVFADVS
jgi:predicted transcriptional regulator